MRAGCTWGLMGGTLHLDGTLAWQQAFATRGDLGASNGLVQSRNPRMVARLSKSWHPRNFLDR